jgi:hypothetical protein
MHNRFWEWMEMTPARSGTDSGCLEMPPVAQRQEPADSAVSAGISGSCSTTMVGNQAKSRCAVNPRELTEGEYKSGAALRKVSGATNSSGIIVMQPIDPVLAFNAFLRVFGFPPRSRPGADLLSFPTGRPLLNRKDQTPGSE